MRYIQQLQQDVKQLNNTVCDVESLLLDLRSYLLSDKFSAEGELQNYVNVKDVLSYISTARNSILEGTTNLNTIKSSNT